ncbi:hypothetical protein L1987_87664 [Smallanthus sonchifolius]|nr:hypothetical protein L1987_87664 [Smallanthus sonchifolius]
MASPSSTSVHHLVLSLFLVFSVTTAGPHHGIGLRRHGRGHKGGAEIPPGEVPPGDPAIVPPGNPAVLPDGTPVVVPGGTPAVVPPGTPAIVPPGNPAVVPPGTPVAENDIETNFKGSWAIDNPNVGVAAMQFQLMPNNKAVWFDTTSLGPSARELGPPGNCPKSPEMNLKPDCYAHAIAYDVETGQSRTIYMDGEPWCSSGHLWPTGDLVATGGTRGGVKSVRMLALNDPNANFVEKKNILADNRWYSSNQVLEDGSAVVVGGRNSFSYEIVPPNKLEFPSKKFNLRFLQETTVPKKPGPGMYIENNLYPFLFLVPDGNVFLFANDRGIIFHPQTGAGVAGWENAIDPNLTPILYTPCKPMGRRFKEMAPTKIARMYHSVSALIPDAKILVAGSNPHSKYLLKAEYPTELRVEKFSPHYLDPALAGQRPVISPETSDKVLKYAKEFKIGVKFNGGQANPQNVKVTMVYPPFTTHGFSMNQRLVVLPLKTVANGLITAIAPPSGKIAPPGYYMLFVNFRGIPGKGIWVHVD